MSDNPIRAQPPTNTLGWHIRGWGTVVSPIAIIAAVWWVIYRFFHYFNPFLLLMALPALAVVAVFSYRRYFHPERLPAMLSDEELAKLKRRQRNLAWAGFLGIAFIPVVLGVAYFAPDTDIKKEHLISDAVAYWFLLPAIVSCICFSWREALKAYIQQRTARPKSSSSFSRPAVPIGKPFHSEHWGTRVSSPTEHSRQMDISGR
jgi:hypothetical protein